MEQAEAKVIGVHFSRFEKGVKGYRLWDSKNKKVLSRDVIFDKRLRAKDIDKEEVHEKNHTEVPLSKEESIPENHAEVEQAPGKHEAPEEQQAPEEVQAEPTSIAQSRSRRVIKPPQGLGWEDEACYTLLASGNNPSSFQEAVKSDERQKNGWMLCRQKRNHLYEFCLGVSSET